MSSILYLINRAESSPRSGEMVTFRLFFVQQDLCQTANHQAVQQAGGSRKAACSVRLAGLGYHNLASSNSIQLAFKGLYARTEMPGPTIGYP